MTRGRTNKSFTYRSVNFYNLVSIPCLQQPALKPVKEK
uniref:Uncharacterized protein n=1 Tax=Anguilla anguilla TaxID=7936 RepID=A0A0E9VDF8_ANGAN